MTKLSYILSVILLAANFTLHAGQKEYKGKMGITPVQLEQKGDSIYIAIDFDISGVNVGSQRSISLVPVLVAPGQEMPLPEVMVKGRLNYLTSKRELALMGKSERSDYMSKAPYAILKGYKSRDTKQIRYTKVLPFENWMKDARLDIREDLCGCGNPPRILELSQLVNAVQIEAEPQSYTVTPHIAYIRAAPETVKQRAMESEAFLDFAINRTHIMPGYMNNPVELAKITGMLDSLRADPYITVKDISVTGYASPEGYHSQNKRLAEGRAKALVAYLETRFNYPHDMYHIQYGGENWIGLSAILDTARFKYRDEVISIVNNKSISDEARKSYLKQLHYCEPYRYMLKEFYPSLRKAVCRITYEVRAFDISEAGEIFKTAPENLSLCEMFLLADSYEKGSPEFMDIFDTAVKIYPRNETANLNAAVTALSRRDTLSAEYYLAKVTTPSPEYYNTVGVLMLLKDNYTQASVYLHKAAEAGLETALLNLAELQKKQESILRTKK